MIDPLQIDALLVQARQARRHAYCPHSRFAVGAALLTNTGAVYYGCNVENASFGLSICAERNAVAAAIADGMQPGMLIAVALVTDSSKPITPCGACLQVLAEFAAEECEVICATLREDILQVAMLRQRLNELLPSAFSM